MNPTDSVPAGDARDGSPSTRSGSIAVIGMAGRYPGARDLHQFWRNLKDGVDCVTRFRRQELLADGFPAAVVDDPEFVAAKGVLEDAEWFDAGFFRMAPGVARVVGPQHRLFLECAQEALEDAGHDPARAPGPIGVYAGETINTYLLFGLQHGLEYDFQTVLGNDKDYLTTRASYLLGLEGPSVDVQAGCSTSLVAVHMACRALVDRECDLALAGAVSIPLTHVDGHTSLLGGAFHVEGGVYSPDGTCRAFDARAAGIVGGSGVGLVVLRRLEDALADGDSIRAVLLGSAINNDGASKSDYAAPSVAGQQRVLAAALASAGVEPPTIGFIEAHGTATRIGDRTELEAFHRVFGRRPDRRASCALGSVKTNIGHLDAAAGIASLHKAVLSIEKGVVPPSLHFEQPSEELASENSPFYVNTQCRAWRTEDAPRRAGVSSYGLGGTNAHVVLEQAPARPPSDPSPDWNLLLLSARTPTALDAATQRLVDHLAHSAHGARGEIADVAFTLQLGRRNFEHRRFLVCHAAEDAIRAGIPSADGGWEAGVQDAHQRVALLVSEVRRDSPALVAAGPAYRSATDECLRSAAGRTLEKPRAQNFAITYAHARAWIACGARPELIVGRDEIGERVAAVLTGVLRLSDAVEWSLGRDPTEDRALGTAQVALALPRLGRRVETGAAASATLFVPVNTVDLSGSIVAPLEDPWLALDLGGEAGELDCAHRIAAEADTRETLLRTLGRLWLRGVAVDWRPIHGQGRRRRIPLPTYPFERRRYWLDGLSRAPGQESRAPAEVAAAPMLDPQEHLPRAERLFLQLRELVGRLAGIDEAEIDASVTLLELGMDSLLLIQTSQEIKQAYGIEAPLNRLLDPDTTLESLAIRLDDELPAGRQPTAASAPVPELDRARPSASTPRGVRGAGQDSGKAEPGAGASASLSERQRRHLDEFIERYTRKTQGSKRRTQEQRACFSDSTAAWSFRPLWKELIYPLHAGRAAGSRIWDVDGNEYVDQMCSAGVTLFGNSPRFQRRALEAQLALGLPLGMRSQGAGRAAELFRRLTGNERVDFCNSGTEAVMAALRIARTVTGRPRMVLFTGAYHGWSDIVLARGRGRAGAETALPMALGIMPGAVEDVVVLDYGTPEALDYIEAHAQELACVLAEPVQSGYPDNQPRAFLQDVRRITERSGTALIFDEMITGLRAHARGAAGILGVEPDLSTYGKVLGGGLPIGAIAGRTEWMDALDGGWWNFGDDSYPEAARTFFGGTFCKNPLSMAAAVAVLEHLLEAGPGLQAELNRRTDDFVLSLNDGLTAREVPARVTHFSSQYRFVFDAKLRFSDLFFFHLIERGVFSEMGAGNSFVSTAHSDADLDLIRTAVFDAVDELRESGFLHEPRDPSAPASSPGSGPQRARSAVREVPRHETPRHAVPAQALSTTPAPTAQAALRSPRFSLSYFGRYDGAYRGDKYDLLLEGARFADRNDFHAVWIPERHFGALGGISPNPSVLAAALARETQHVRLHAGSVVVPLHHPIRVAEEWSVVDNLSKGRVGVSFATGWHPDDFALAPDAYADRRAQAARAIESIRSLWRGDELAATSGSGASIGVRLVPMPLQAELPVWISCASRAGFENAGKIGAGVLANLQHTTSFQSQAIEELAQKIALYRAARADHGHAANTGTVTLLLHTYLGTDFETVRERARAPFYRYMRSVMKLNQGALRTERGEVDLDRVSEADMEFILSNAYERYLADRALIGTPASCLGLVERLSRAGVDEIACMIDFGVATPAVLEGLAELQSLKQTCAASFGPEARPEPCLQDDGPTTILPRTRGPLSFAQERVWYLDQVSPHDPSFRTGTAELLSGPLDVDALTRALRELVERQEILRTSYRVVDGEPSQEIQPLGDWGPEFVDLRGSPSESRNEELQRRAREETLRTFDLSEAPVIRATLFRLAEEEHALVLVMHQVAVDGWSVGLIQKELTARYRSILQGAPTEQPALPLRFIDHSFAERSESVLRRPGFQLEGRDPDVRMARWMRRLADAPPLLKLAPGHMVPKESRPIWHTFRLSEPLAARVLDLAKRARVTPFMTLLAAYQCLLSRITGQLDVIVGTPFANRPLPDCADVVGFFVNPVPLRTKLTGDPTFHEVLGRVREVALEAMELQDVPFAEVVRALALPRVEGQPLLFSAMFLFQNYPWEEFELGPLTCKPLCLGSAPLEFPLELEVYREGDSFRCELGYEQGCRETLEGFPEQFLALLETVTGNSESRLAELPGARQPLPAACATPVPTSWNGAAEGDGRVEDLYELSPGQLELVHRTGPRNHDSEELRGIWVHAVHELEGDLELSLFEAAWQHVIDRHPAARTSIHTLDLERPHQAVHRRVPVEITIVSLEKLGPDAQQAHLASALETALATEPPLDVAPLMRLALTQLGALRYVLHWSYARVILDSPSAALLFEEALAIYEKLRTGEPVELSPAPRFRDFILGCAQRQDATSTLAPLFAGPGSRDVHHREGRLSPGAHAQLDELARKLGTDLGPLFWAAWGLVLGENRGTDEVRLGCSLSHRGDPQRSTAGFFNATHPLALVIDEQRRLEPFLEELARRGSEMESQGPRPPDDGLGRIETSVVFDTTGRTPSGSERGRRLRCVHSSARSGGGQQPLALEIHGGSGSGLHVHLSNDALQVSDEESARLLERLLATLEELAHHLPRPISELRAAVSSRLAKPESAERREARVAVAAMQPLTEAEQILAALWSELLGVQRVAPTDNFFDLGGHSLLLVRVIDRVEREHGIRLPLGALIYATLRQSAGIFDALRSAAASKPEPVGIRARLRRLVGRDPSGME